MSHFLFFATIIALSFQSIGQTVIIKQENLEDFGIDQLQNIYTKSGNNLTKYNSSGVSTQQFSHSIYGQISSFDVTDPLRIMLFYKESNALLFVNQQLAIIGDPIELDQIGDIQAKLACISNQGGFWVYDELSQTILYYDANRIQRFQSQNIPSLSKDANPLFLQEKANVLYLSLKNETLVFDQFGGYISRLPVCVESDITPTKNHINFWNGTHWVKYNTLLKEQILIKLPITNGLKTIPLGNEHWLQLNQNQLIKIAK